MNLVSKAMHKVTLKSFYKSEINGKALKSATKYGNTIDQTLQFWFRKWPFFLSGSHEKFFLKC